MQQKIPPIFVTIAPRPTQYRAMNKNPESTTLRAPKHTSRMQWSPGGKAAPSLWFILPLLSTHTWHSGPSKQERAGSISMTQVNERFPSFQAPQAKATFEDKGIHLSS